MTVKGLTTPKRWLRVAVVLWRYEGLARDLLLDWYLGSQKLREILTLLCCITPSSSGKTNSSSRRSKKDFWRRCRGGLRQAKSRFTLPSTSHFWRCCRGSLRKSQHTKYPSQSLSLALHYLPFASRFPLPHFTLAVLFALSFPLPFVCSCVSLLACSSRWPYLILVIFTLKG